MLDADLNARYWGYMARRYQKYELWPKVILAVMGTGTIVSWVSRVSWLNPILTLATAVLATSLPFFKLTKQVEKMAGLRGVWSGIHFELSRLWARIDSLEAQTVDAELRKIQDRFVTVKEGEALLPHDSKLLNKCWEEVVAGMGLT
jgi:hypothetical protein